MRNRSMHILIGFLCLTNMAAAKSPFAGTWEGKINDQPGVELRIEDAGGKITGVVVFYFQTRSEDGNWHVADKFTEPLLATRVKGRILAFEAAHSKTHGSSELGPNVDFRLELVQANEAVLRKAEDQPDAPPLKLIRRE